MQHKPLQEIRNLLDKVLAPKLGTFVIVDIGDDLKVADIDMAGGVRINAFKVTKLPEQNRKEATLAALEGFIRDNNIQHGNAILKVSLGSLIIKRLSIPSIPSSEIPDAIKWQLKEEVNLDLSRVVMDFTILKENTQASGAKTMDIVCIMAKEEDIKSQVLLLKEAGLTCVKASVLSRGYINIIEKLRGAQDKKAKALLHMDDNLGLIFIEKDGQMEFYRELPLSVGQLREALSAKISTSKGTINLSADDIEKVLFEKGIPTGDVEAEVMAMLRPALERLSQEIKRSLSYYSSQLEGEELSNIFIGGLAAGIPKLDDFLTRELGTEAKCISLKGLIKVPEGLNESLLLENSGLFGLAFDPEKGVNLLPYEFRAEKFEAIQKLSLRWVAIGISCFLAVSLIFGKVGIMSYQKRLDNARIHLNVLSEVRNSKVNLDELKSFASQVEHIQPDVDGVLQVISEISPRELFLNSMSLNFISKSGSMDGIIESQGDDPDGLLSEFVGDLKASGFFEDTSLDLVEKPAQGMLKFKLNFKLS